MNHDSSVSRLPRSGERKRDQIFSAANTVCDQEKLSAFLDGELTDAERDGLLAHLETCEACRTYLAELTALHDALGAMEEIDAPAGFAESVLARLHGENPERAWTASEPKKRRAWRGWAGLAACAAVVVLAVSALPRMGGSGSDSAAPASGTSSASVQSSVQSSGFDAVAEVASEEAESDEEFAAELMTEFAAPEAPEAPMAGPGSAANDSALSGDQAKRFTAATTEAAEYDAGEDGAQASVLTLMGEGAEDWLAEHGEPLGDGRWLVTVEDTNALPDTLELVAADGLQEPVDGMLIITFGTTENPR